MCSHCFRNTATLRTTQTRLCKLGCMQICTTRTCMQTCSFICLQNLVWNKQAQQAQQAQPEPATACKFRCKQTRSKSANKHNALSSSERMYRNIIKYAAAVAESSTDHLIHEQQQNDAPWHHHDVHRLWMSSPPRAPSLSAPAAIKILSGILSSGCETSARRSTFRSGRYEKWSAVPMFRSQCSLRFF